MSYNLLMQIYAGNDVQEVTLSPLVRMKFYLEAKHNAPVWMRQCPLLAWTNFLSLVLVEEMCSCVKVSAGHATGAARRARPPNGSIEDTVK